MSWPTGRPGSLLALLFAVCVLVATRALSSSAGPVGLSHCAGSCAGLVAVPRGGDTTQGEKARGGTPLSTSIACAPRAHWGLWKDVGPALRVGSAAAWLRSGGAFVKIYVCWAPILGGKSVSRS